MLRVPHGEEVQQWSIQHWILLQVGLSDSIWTMLSIVDNMGSSSFPFIFTSKRTSLNYFILKQYTQSSLMLTGWLITLNVLIY